MMNTTLIIILIIISYVIFSIWCTGLLFANFQAKYPEIAVKEKRQDLVVAVFIGFFSGLLSIIGVGVVYHLTGFGEHGWRIK